MVINLGWEEESTNYLVMLKNIDINIPFFKRRELITSYFIYSERNESPSKHCSSTVKQYGVSFKHVIYTVKVVF